MANKQNIRSLSLKDIEAFLISVNQKPFRAKQIHEWLWKKNIVSFDEMNNISKELRTLLGNSFYVNSIITDKVLKSTDGTIKVAFRLNDGNLIEGVLIPKNERVTACISSQVGCALNCGFCATGKAGFKRNLDYQEIYDQVVLLNSLSELNYSQHITHYVLMGMGEPLMNYDNVLKAVNMLCSTEGYAISPKRITLSTAGIPDKIKRLANDDVKFNLAISLHSANNIKRNKFVPINKKYPLPELSEAIKYFHSRTGTRITYEYLLLKDVNDSIADAQEFANFCKITPCKINLIEYNPNDIPGFSKTDATKAKAFADFLKSLNLVVNLRRSRGKDIKAACGQLAGISKESKETI